MSNTSELIKNAFSKRYDTDLIICVNGVQKYHDNGDELNLYGGDNYVSFGYMKNFYIYKETDIPEGSNIYPKKESPFNRIMNNFVKADAYELSFGYFPPYIDKDLVGNGFHYLYRNFGMEVFIEKKEVEQEAWNAIIKPSGANNVHKLIYFRLAKPWVNYKNYEDFTGSKFGQHDDRDGFLSPNYD